jgi:predicted RNA binding protein YcfA (HicA-like mRNA interferase family)
MPRLKGLSGDDVIAILGRFGFEVHAQRGSHVKVVRTSEGHRQVLTVPKYRELDRGTLQAIYRQAYKFISADELRDSFYTA